MKAERPEKIAYPLTIDGVHPFTGELSDADASRNQTIDEYEAWLQEWTKVRLPEIIHRSYYSKDHFTVNEITASLLGTPPPEREG